MTSILKRLKYEFTSITIAPFVLFFIFARQIDHGAQVTTNLMIYKICELELNYSKEICSNLTLTEYEEYNHEVQRQVATIQAAGHYIGEYKSPINPIKTLTTIFQVLFLPCFIHSLSVLYLMILVENH